MKSTNEESMTLWSELKKTWKNDVMGKHWETIYNGVMIQPYEGPSNDIMEKYCETASNGLVMQFRW